MSAVPSHDMRIGRSTGVPLKLLLDIVEINARRAEGVVGPTGAVFEEAK
jgi:hypothetical protein